MINNKICLGKNYQAKITGFNGLVWVTVTDIKDHGYEVKEFKTEKKFFISDNNEKEYIKI